MSPAQRREALAAFKAAGSVVLLFLVLAALVAVGLWTTTLQP